MSKNRFIIFRSQILNRKSPEGLIRTYLFVCLFIYLSHTMKALGRGCVCLNISMFHLQKLLNVFCIEGRH